MAGIFTKDNRFAILTREAVPEFYSIHNRMPVIIPNHLKDIWLNESAEVLHDSLTKLCCTYAEEKPKSGTEQISFFTLIHHP
jgi:putative SOS response-associated peptidase YedK